MKKTILLTMILLFMLACQSEKKNMSFNSIAEKYVKTVLELGLYDADFVDAYYGPDEWKQIEKQEVFPYDSLSESALSLKKEIEKMLELNISEEEILRGKYLLKQTEAILARIEIVNGNVLSFDEESKRLFDAVTPIYEDKYFEDKILELDKLLPGKGDIRERFEKYRSRFVIPDEKLEEVFSNAIEVVRAKTKKYVNILSENESFTIEYVTNKPWGAYNWYKGNNFSLIQFNKDIKSYLERPLDLASHEGYPGHHVYNSLLETKLYKEKGWVEFSVYALFSPQSLIAEGTANYAISLLFTEEERLEIEYSWFKDLGFSKEDIKQYHKILNLTGNLDFAGNIAAKNYLEKTFTKEQAVDYMVRYLLMTKERAEKRLEFVEKYRSYVINYNVGTVLIDEYISKKVPDNNLEKKWEYFIEILSKPFTPEMLRN